MSSDHTVPAPHDLILTATRTATSPFEAAKRADIVSNTKLKLLFFLQRFYEFKPLNYSL